MNIVNVMNNQSIESTTKTAIDALTTITKNTNIINAPAVAKANKLMRSVGLGQMNLHGFLAQNKIAYESEEVRDFVYFMMVNYYSLQRSMEIAKETGKHITSLKDRLTKQASTSKSMKRTALSLSLKKFRNCLEINIFQINLIGES